MITGSRLYPHPPLTDSSGINQQPLKGSEIELRYCCTLVCHEKDEARVRTALLQSLGGGTNLRIKTAWAHPGIEES